MSEMNSLNRNGAVVEVIGLKKYFPARGDWFAQLFDRRLIKAVDDVSFTIDRGTTLGLVGESGSGKTTTGRLIAHLGTPNAGKVRYEGEDIAHLKGKDLQAFRRSVQMVFQDPSSSLNRRKTVGQIIQEPLRIQPAEVLNVIRALEAIYRSAAEGREIRLDRDDG